MTATLAQLRTLLERGTELLTELQQQQAPPVVHTIDIKAARIELHAGERYAGPLLDAQGRTLHHVVILDGDAEPATHQEQLAWAAACGADLLSPPEQQLARANCPDRFKPEAYWSNKVDESDSSSAWYQDFRHGHQNIGYRSAQLRAVAVRRVPA